MPPSYTQLEIFADQVYGTLIRQLLHILKVKPDNEICNKIASHLGKSLGIIEAIRQTRNNALMSSQRTAGAGTSQFIMLPADICAKHQVTEYMIFQAKPGNKQLSNAVFEMANFANAHLEAARNLKKQSPAQAVPAFYVAVFCNTFLVRLKKNNFDMFAHEMDEGLYKARYAFELIVKTALKSW